MLQKVNPMETIRAKGYELFHNMTNPMITFTKKFDITNVIKQAKKGYKLNLIMCYLICKASRSIPEFRYSVRKDGFYYSDELCMSMIAKCKDNSIAFCNVEYNDDFSQFEENYFFASNYCYENCKHFLKEDCAIIGTSTLTLTSIESVVNGYNEDFMSPFLIWGKYTKKMFKKYVNLSFQFHHAQMDGEHACKFFVSLQNEMSNFKLPRKKQK